MRILYFKVDGQAQVEKTNNIPRLFEMPDGYHPVTNDSVWQDAKRTREPILIFIQGVRGPYGATMENEDVSSVLYEIELAERAFRKPNVSKMWYRALLRMLEWVYARGVPMVGIIIVAYFFVRGMLSGV